MRKRKISTRAGAWILSAAMLINGMPLNVFAESAEDGIYTENVDTSGGESADSGETGDVSTQGGQEATAASGENDSAGENGADNGGAGGAGTTGTTETAGETGAGNVDADITEGGNDVSGSTEDTAATDDNSGFTDSGETSQDGTSDSDEENTDAITSHDAVFQVLWSDENNLADRRDDQDLSKRFTIYQNGQPMESQPQIILDKEMEDGAGETRLGTYRVQSLPDSDGNGTDYTYSIKEIAPAGYEAFTADAVTGLDEEATSAFLAQLIAPDQELPVTLAEGDSLYRADKMFGNYLRQYTFEGSITWNDNANQQNIRPDLESWFQNHIQITRDGAAYKSFRVHYEQNADDESVWNYQIKGLFAIKEDKTQATYQISLNVPEGYTTENGDFTVTENQSDCQTVFELIPAEPTETPEIEPTEVPKETLEAEPTEAPAENSEIDSTQSEIALFAAQPQAASIVEVKESNGTAELNVQFLDKTAKAEADYYELLNKAGMTLQFQIGEQSYSVKLEHGESGWVVTAAEGAADGLNLLASAGISASDLAAKITSSWTLGTGKVSVGNLPSMISVDGTEQTVSWNLSMGTSASGYCNAVVESNTYKFVPYYTNSDDEEFSITIDVREGDIRLDENAGEVQELLKQLTLSYSSDQAGAQTISVANILNKKNLPEAFKNAEIVPIYNSTTNTITLTVKNIPWCDTDKYEYTYSITAANEITNTNSEIGSIPENDKLVPRYDNAQSSNFSSITDSCHDKGILYLTLQGETNYTGNKIWLDDGKDETKAARPNVTWKLWRYPQKEGVDYTKASPVTENGTQISWSINKDVNAGVSTSYGTKADTEGNIILPSQSGETSLPKYDSDGYPYVYLIRESGNNGYEQVYGTVTQNEDKSFTVTPNSNDPYKGNLTNRGSDTSLYNGGTLSNRITGTTSTSVRKVWENAAHQDSIQNVEVKLTLQASYDGKTWEDVKTITMSGFRSEIQEQEASASAPKYDELGRPLTYRWIESDISEKINGTDNAEIKEWEDPENKIGVKKFVLASTKNKETLADGDEWYESEYSKENGVTVITNRLVGTTNYFVDKVWNGWTNSTDDGKTAPDGKENEEITVILYQDDQPYKDADGNVIEYKISKNSTTKDPENEKERPWSKLIENLPKYSPDGHKYIYYAIEKQESSAVANYTYNVKDLNKFSPNNALISNSPGESGKYIRVEKKWEDDGDRDNRLPVHVGVWRVKRGEEKEDKYLGQVTLTEDNSWWSYFSITEKGSLASDEYYIREIGMGNTGSEFETKTSSDHVQNGNKNPYLQGNTISDNAVTESGDALVSTNGAPAQNQVVDYIDTDQYRYDVTYSLIKGYTAEENESIFPVDTYCVTNHRYGWINLTVTKTWVDDGQTSETRQAFLARLKLEIANPLGELTGVSISEDGNSVIANGISYPIYTTDLKTQGNAIQNIGDTGDSGNTETIGFFNLPKFDEKGVKIRYRVSEQAPKTQNGQSVTDENNNLTFSDVTNGSTTLSDKDYATSITYGTYQVSGEKHALDTQAVSVTNTRSNTRNVIFYKLWIDQALKTNRPDIYFTLYQKSGDGQPEKYGTFRPYEVSETADGAYMIYEFSNLPKYDKNGAFITYYATEGMHVDGAALDYIPVQYYYSENPAFAASTNGLTAGLKKTYLANATGYADISYSESADGRNGNYTVTNTPKGDENVLAAADGTVVLKENGTFVNEVRSTAKVDGKKIWKNVLADFPKNQLPALNFDLMQSVVGENEAPVKVAEFDAPLGTDENATEFAFRMRYLGINTKDGGYVSGLDGDKVTDTWTQLLPKYDENGRMYKYELVERFTGNGTESLKNLYTVSSSTHSYLVNNTFKQQNKKIAVKKVWDSSTGVAGKRPDVTFRLYRFFATKDTNGNDTYTEPQVIQTKVLTNGQETVIFDNLYKYAPDRTDCYYYIEEIVPNGYEKDATSPVITVTEGDETGITLVPQNQLSTLTKKGGVTSQVFIFNDAEPTTWSTTEGTPAAVTFQNKYLEKQTETVALTGQKKWEDNNNAFGTRPTEINITLTRHAVSNTQGNTSNDITSENVFGNDEKIVLSIPTASGSNEVSTTYVKSSKGSTGNVVEKSNMVNTYAQGVTVTVRQNSNDTNAWDYEISGLDKYAPNGGEWIYTITESEVTLKNGSNEIGRYEISNSVNSGNGTTGLNLTNTLPTTSVTISKSWENQHPIIAKEMKVVAELYVKIGDEQYQKASLVTDGGANVFGNAVTTSVTLNEGNIGWTATIANLPTVIKYKGEFQPCEYIAVETKIIHENSSESGTSSDASGDAFTLELTPQITEENGNITVTYTGDTGRYGITHKISTTGNKTAVQINNTLEDDKKTQIRFSKLWNDQDNKFKTRPSQIRIQLQRKIDRQEFDNIDGAVWTLNIGSDGKINGLKSGGNDSGMFSVSNGVCTVSGLPKADANGNTYQYRIVEIGQDVDKVLENGTYTGITGNDTDTTGIIASSATSKKTAGSYYNVSTSTSNDNDGVQNTVIKNTLETTSLAVTKKWVNDQTSFRPESLNLTLHRYRLDKDGKKVSDSDENVTYPDPQPTWTKNKSNNTWSLTYSGLPKYYGAYTDNGNLIGLSYYYYVTEDNAPQAGYLEPEYENPVINTTSGVIVGASETITNKATEFQMDKIWKNGDDEESIRNRALKILLKGTDTIAKYTAEWSRTAEGIESVSVKKENKVIYSATATTETEHVTIKGLPVGTYSLSEVDTPLGYEKIADATITFASTSNENTIQTLSATISSSDQAVTQSETKGMLLIKVQDNKTSLEIRKTDLKGNALYGAEFKLVPAEGSSFVSSGIKEMNFTVNANGIVTDPTDQTNPINPTIGELIINNIYILTETKAPEGYILPGGNTPNLSVKFSLNEKGEIVFAEDQEQSFADWKQYITVTTGDADSLTIKNKPIEITLQKTDVNNAEKKLSGAVFNLTDITDSDQTKHTSTTVTTAEEGKIVLSGIGQGSEKRVPIIQGHTYTLQETKAPAGYKLPDNPPDNPPVLTFEVNEDGTVTFKSTVPQEYTGTGTSSITVTNTPAEFSVVKVDSEDNTKLQNAEFKLSRQTGKNTWEEVVSGIKTDANGKIVFKTGNQKDENNTYTLLTYDENNNYQTYKLEETTATPGYELAKPFTFRLNANGTVTDIEKGDNEEGIITLSNEQSNSVLTVKDNKTAFRLNKIDTESQSDLSNEKLTLTVTDKNKKQVFTWSRKVIENVINVNVSVNTALYPKITYSSADDLIYGLPAGTYTIQETATPLGYLTARSVSFKMNQDGTLSYASESDTSSKEDNSTITALSPNSTEKLLLTIKDEPVRGHVKLTKTLAGEPLAGVTFNLYRVAKSGVNADASSESEDVLVASGITTGNDGTWTSVGSDIDFASNSGDTGKLLKGLPSGQYYFVETATTADSVLNSTAHVGAFTITANSNSTLFEQPALIEVEVSNEKFSAAVELTKYDEVSGKPVPKGVSFKLTRTSYEADGKTYPAGKSAAYEVTKKVDANGTIRFDNLTKGTYLLEEIENPLGYENGVNNENLFKATFEIGEADNGKTLTVSQSSPYKKRFTVISGLWDGKGILNTPKTATVILYKKGKTTNGNISLEGVKFKLQKKVQKTGSGDEVFEDWMTGLETGKEYAYTDTKTDNPTSTADLSEETGIPLKITGLKWGTYRLVETGAKAGYSIVNDKNAVVSVEFTVNQDTKFAQPITFGTNGKEIFNYQTKLRIVKTGVGETTNLKDAVFTITGRFADYPISSGVTKEFKTDGNGELILTGLLIGGESYSLQEKTPPAGYECLSGSVTFEMNADGTITIVSASENAGYTLTKAESFDNLITVTDNKIQIRLEKYSDAEPATKLTGAEFKVTPAIETETFADDKTKSITLTDANMSTGLEGMVIAGHSYKVTETKAPDGYKLAADFTFEVNEDGSVEITNPASNSFVTVADDNGIAVIKVTDSKNELVISKTDENGEPLSEEVMRHVQLTITDITNVSEGNIGTVVMNLTAAPSASDPYTYNANSASWTIRGQLIQGHKYRLTETGIPDNYLIAAPVEFEMGTNGKVTIISGAYSNPGQISAQDKRANNLYVAGEQNDSLVIRDTEVKATVTITKTETGNTSTMIPNVEFEFYRQNANGTSELIPNNTVNPTSSTWTTDVDGKLTINGLSVGNYYFKEVKADGYAYDTAKVYRVSVNKSAENDQIEVTYGDGFKVNSSGSVEPVVENSRTVLTIKKVDESGEKLDPTYMSQVELTLTDKTDNRALILKVPKNSSNDDVNETNHVTYNESDGSWTITGWLIQGHEYTLKETRRPYEYRTAQEITFKMGELGRITEVQNAYASTSGTLSVSDKKITGKLTLTKTLEKGNAVSVLEGVVFDLYRRTPKGTSVYRENLTTNISGQIVVENLPEGTYYFVEKEAPGNIYMDGGKTAEVTIDESGTDGENLAKAITKSDIPFETKVELIKAEENDENTVIPGTEFTLSKFDKDGNPVPEKTTKEFTGADGKVTFVIDEAGTYRIKETKPAYGYENSNYEKTFIVTNTNDFQGKISDFGKVTNQRQTGSVTVTKKDSTNQTKVTGINGITFELYKVNGEGESGAGDTKLGTFQTGNIYTRDTNAESGWSKQETSEDQPGLLKISGLDWGSYYLKETVADVYQVDSTNRYEFKISNIKNDKEKSGIDVTLDDILNIQNQLTITKIDQDGKPLGNVVDQKTLSDLELTVKEVLADQSEKDVVVLKPAASANGEYSYDPATTTWTLTGKLTQGHTYKLVETGRPEGYVTAQPITFIMGQDGKIQVQGSSAEKVSANDSSVKNGSAGTTNLYTDAALAVRDVKLQADICLEKKGENGEKVKGAVFSLYKLVGKNADPSKDELIADGLETDEDGKTKVQTVGEGFYYFVETSAPSDKVLDSTPTAPVQVSENQHGTVVTVPAVNKAFHYSVEITKKDGTDKTLLDGVEFTLYEVVAADENGDSETIAAEKFVKVASGTTGSENNETGKLTFNITKAGTYEIQETGTIYGYEFNKDNPYKHRFTISNTDEYQNKQLSLEVENTRSTGTVSLIKKDGETDEALNDIIFALYYKAPGTEEYKKILDTVTGKTYTGKITESGSVTKGGATAEARTTWEENTGNAGEISVDSLAWGDYYIIEIKADGYVLKDSEYHFTIGKVQSLTSGLNVNLTAKYGEITNEPNQLLIGKQDTEGNLIGGAQLLLTGPKNYKETWTSVQNGAHLLKRLPEGDYTLTETKAPEGYIRSTEEIHFTVAAGGKILDANGTELKETEEKPVTITMTNTRNSLTITKVDENGKPLNENAMKTLELTVTDVTAADKLEAANEERTAPQTLTAENLTEAKNWLLEGIFAAGHTYKLEETAEKRPYGYLLAEPITFTMGEDGTLQDVKGVMQGTSAAGTTNLYTADSLTVRDVAIKGSIQLNKKGSDQKPLENVSFLLYRMNGTAPDTEADTQIPFSKEKAEYTTNEYGQIKVTDLPEGKYYFAEVAAPDNVFMDAAKTEVLTIDPTTNGQTQEIEKIDTDFTTSVKLFKADNFDETIKSGIEGVEFTLYKLEDKKDKEEAETSEKNQIFQKLETKVTDEDGNVSFTIKEAGTYRVQETASAYGYEYDKDKAYTADFVILNTADFQNNVLYLANTVDTAKTELAGTLESYQLAITNALADKWQQAVTNQRQTGSVTLSKKDNTDPENITDLNGVTFALYKAGESQALGTFQTGKAYEKSTEAKDGWKELGLAQKTGTLTISGLEWGSYYLKETKADSYVVSDTKYAFTIGNVQDEKTHSGLSVDLGTIYNEKIRGDLLLKKKDGQGNPLENAVFTLYKLKGAAIDTSTDEKLQENLTTDKNGEIRVEKLPEGKYYFVETAAPDNIFMDGRNSDIAVIDQTVHGKTVEVDMVNTDFQAGVELVKTDIDTGAALAGVEFTLYREENGAYAEVTREETGADGKVAFTLNQAGRYKLVETIGAYGYDYDSENPYTAEFAVTNTADFQNTVLTLADSVSEAVAKKYDVKISGNLSQNTSSVTNKKTPAEETGSITVTKYLQLDGMTNGLEIGTADTTFYTALFTDAEGTRRYSDVKELHIQNGTSTSVTFDGLPKGTYYVFETFADGTRIPYEELTADVNGNMYYCTGIGTENIAISPQLKEASAELYNWYMDLPDGYYLSGRLEITKNVIKNGETTETDDTFYAGIFDETGSLVTVAELLQNGTVTVDVRLGGDDSTQPVTYTVMETDKDGNPLDESFPYEIEVSGSGYVSKENPVGKITITNTVIEEEPTPTPTETPEPTETPVPSETPGNGGSDGNGSQGTSNVKTGDDTNVQPFILLFLISGCVLIYAGRRRRKSAK